MKIQLASRNRQLEAMDALDKLSRVKKEFLSTFMNTLLNKITCKLPNELANALANTNVPNAFANANCSNAVPKRLQIAQNATATR